MELDWKLISHILDLTERTSYRRITVQLGDLHISVEKDGGDAALTPPPKPATETLPAATSHEEPTERRDNVPSRAPREVPSSRGKHGPGHVVTAGLMGTCYLTSDPESAPFVEIGQEVTTGQTLCLIEVMKLFSPIEADADGRVAEILVSNGDLVEYGQPLFVLEPS